MQKNKPARTCIGCNEQKEKSDMLRIVKNKEGKIFVDLSGKQSGRGAYVCKNEECLNKLIKSKRLNKAFEMDVSDDIYEEIRSIIVDK